MDDKVLSREQQVELLASGLAICDVMETAIVTLTNGADPERVRTAVETLQAIRVYRAGLVGYQEQLQESAGDIPH